MLFCSTAVSAQQFYIDTLLYTDTVTITCNNISLDAVNGLETTRSYWHFTGDQEITVKRSGPFEKVEINNPAGVRLHRNTTVSDSLIFSIGHLFTGNYFLTAPDFLILSGYDEDKFIVTDSLGYVLQYQNAGTAEIPVGPNIDAYHPIEVSADQYTSYGVQAMPVVYEEGIMGTPITEECIQGAWRLRPIGSDSMFIDVKTFWPEASEQNGFYRSESGVSIYRNNDWDLSPENIAPASTDNNLFYQETTIADTQVVLTVSGRRLVNRAELDLIVLLQGPYQNNIMSEGLRNRSLIPTTSPYGDTRFPIEGIMDYDTVDISVLNNLDAAIVDWVYIALIDTSDASTVVQSIPALVNKYGDVVGLDGFSRPQIPIMNGSYYLGIGHRNHLKARVSFPMAFEKNEETSFDFSTDIQDVFGTDPLADTNGTYALWAGNVKADRFIRATGPPTINDYTHLLKRLGASTTILTNVYDDADINMDGIIRATGPVSINDYSKLLNTLGSSTTIIQESY